MPIPQTVVILGCGYTGARIAVQLAAAGCRVIATSRDATRLKDLPVEALSLDVTSELDFGFVPPNAAVVHSIPTTKPNSPGALAKALAARSPIQVIYLSTTGVYGPVVEVNERTLPVAGTNREQERLDTEDSVQAGPWASLILRPAAIYGPGRGVHISLRRGDLQIVGDGSNWVSRIHVDDLAAHVCAALEANLTGVYPVADEEPATSREIAQFCSDLLGIPLPAPVTAAEAHPTRRANRRVDGSAVRKALGLTLKYSSYRTGIPASLLAEEPQVIAEPSDKKPCVTPEPTDRQS